MGFSRTIKVGGDGACCVPGCPVSPVPVLDANGLVFWTVVSSRTSFAGVILGDALDTERN